MIRHAVAVVAAICLTPSWGFPQTPPLDAGTEPGNAFTVSAQSAAVRKAPSTGSPVIGQAPRGSVLDVTRDIGAWVKVAWPDAEDGIGYVHQSMGSLSKRSTVEERVVAAFPPAPESPPAQVADPTVVTRGPGAVPLGSRTVYVSAPTHNLGFGARMGSTGDSGLDGFGVTSRIWSRSRFGVQVEASRSTLTSTTASGRVSATEFAPSAIYSLPDWVTDNIWLRPYIGGAVPITRSTWKSDTPDANDSTADTSIGYRAFGGAEFTLPAVARFAISADLGYRWFEAPYAGFDQNGPGFTVSAHWYVK
jgi:Bacterial SH3 domain